MTTLRLSIALVLSLCALPVSAASPGTDPSDRVRAELAAGRYWEAIALCEEEVERAPRDPAAWFQLGKVLLELGTDPAVDAGDPALLVGEASSALSKALALDPVAEEVLPYAFDAFLAAGDVEQAAAVAARGVGASTLTEGRPAAVWLERAARAERTRSDADFPQEPEAYAVALAAREARLANARAAQPEHGPLHLEHARFLRGLGLQRRAADVLRQGLSSAPADVDLHRELIDVHVAADVPERLAPIYTDLLEVAPEEGLVWWYRAWVGIVLGERDRKEARFARAADRLAEAARWAEAAAEYAPEHAQGADSLRHRARLGLAFCALAERQHDLARERLTELLARAPERRDERDGLGRSVVDGIGMLGSRYVEAGDYGAGAQLARLVVEVLPEDEAWWNNLGFMAREHAVFLEARGDEAARDVFRESWSAYLSALALSPDNSRTVNDAALIQVYHLREELPRAERMLLEAIALGESRIEALGPDPDEAERFPLALAVGDALENLGYLYYHVQPDPAQALAYYERSLATDSGARWTVANHLAALRGERDPIEERTPPAREIVEPPATPCVPWEDSFDGALARAEREGRPLFLYYRGQALSGIDGEAWDRALDTEGLGEQLATVVPVVADLARHTLTDRRSDGTRIACPRFGRISCGAHVRAAGEFERFFAERHEGRLPGGEEERYHLFGPGGEALEWNEVFMQQLSSGGPVRAPVSALLGPGLDQTPSTLDVPRALAELSRAAREADAAVLQRFAQATTAAEHEALERFLFDLAGDPVERAEVLAALARGNDQARTLLAACLHQSRDAQLQACAAASWQDAEDTAGLARALQWGGSAQARRAAGRRLGELASDPRNQRFLAIAQP